METILESGITEPPQNLMEYRKQLRYLYATSPAVQTFIDFLISISDVPAEIKARFDRPHYEGILFDYWLFGWVVVDKEKPVIYDPGEIRVTAVPGRIDPKIVYKGDDITDHAILIARRTHSFELLGHGALECLAGAKRSFGNAYARSFVPWP